MKLLPRFTSYIKDAAKSVKRISLQEFKEVADETLTELLGIASIVVKMFALRREGEHEVLHLWCTHRDEVALCPHCGSLSTKIHQGRASIHSSFGCVGQKDLYTFSLSPFQKRRLWPNFCRGIALRGFPPQAIHSLRTAYLSGLSYKHPEGCCSS